MKFYYPKGVEITGETDWAKFEKFKKFYSKVYYYVYRDLNLEKIIDELEERKTDLTTEDVVNILRWKIGATEHTSNTVTTRYGIMIDAEKLRREMEKYKDPLCAENTQCSEHAACDMLEALLRKQNGVKTHMGIGPVYAITLLHFLSIGAFPIYDKYAHIALKVIAEDQPFDSLIIDKDLKAEFNPYSEKAKTVFENYQKFYIARLNKLLETINGKNDKPNVDRDLDRALWVYGHLFNENNTNLQRL